MSRVPRVWAIKFLTDFSCLLSGFDVAVRSLGPSCDIAKKAVLPNKAARKVFTVVRCCARQIVNVGKGDSLASAGSCGWGEFSQ